MYPYDNDSTIHPEHQNHHNRSKKIVDQIMEQNNPKSLEIKCMNSLYWYIIIFGLLLFLVSFRFIFQYIQHLRSSWEITINVLQQQPFE